MGRCVRRGGCWRRCQEAQGPRQRTQLSPWTRPGPGCQACAASWRRPAPPSASSDGQTSSSWEQSPSSFLLHLPAHNCSDPYFQMQYFHVCSRFVLVFVPPQVWDAIFCQTSSWKSLMLLKSSKANAADAKPRTPWWRVWNLSQGLRHKVVSKKNPKQQIL